MWWESDYFLVGLQAGPSTHAGPSETAERGRPLQTGRWEG